MLPVPVPTRAAFPSTIAQVTFVDTILESESSRYSRTMPEAAGFVVTTPAFAEDLEILTSLGFAVETIFPADEPRRASLVGHGCRVHLETGPAQSAHLRIVGRDSRRVTTPGGWLVEFVEATRPLVVPPLRSSLVASPSDGTWHAGRAGMLYRDLVPGRQGDCVVASHIRIPEGGPVPDYVHYHDVMFQLIFCHRGWVKVVYEDQGEPFVLGPGDCVIQPPRIRHRVLECSDEMHVVEVGYPAEHITSADPSTELPNGCGDSARRWDGQTFVHFRIDDAQWTGGPGYRSADTGVGRATADLARVEVVDVDAASTWAAPIVPERSFEMLVVLEGAGQLVVGPDATLDLSASASAVIPVGSDAIFTATQATRLLRVRIATVQ